MKRFYKTARAGAGDDGLYRIYLDDREVKTPAKVALVSDNQELADMIAGEWDAQVETINPETMPLTQLLNTKIDRVSNNRAALAAEVLKFFDTDLICYYSDNPAEVYKRQKSAWNNAHLWFAEKSGESLQTTQDIAALKQSDKAHAFIAGYVNDLDDDRFTLLQIATPLCGSIVLAAAFIEGTLKAEDLRKAVFIEEDYKSEFYNEDFYGQDPHWAKKRAAFERDMQAAQSYLATLKG